MKKIMLVFGTRPEAIKMAPLVKALEAEASFQSVVVVTAQHREMLDQVLQLFDITPDYDLNIMKPGQSLSDITAGVLRGLERIIIKETPDVVLVHGDTSTTFAAALAAFYQQVPIGHVEAGLRSGNMNAPFPEEGNRRLTGVMTRLHFAPTTQARENLLQENTPADHIFITGNTVIDALQSTVDDGYQFADAHLNTLLGYGGRRLLLTTHRRENLGDPMVQIFQAVRALHDRYDDLQVLFPVHLNPRIRALAEEALGDLPRVHRIEPLDYEPFVNLINRMDVVLTDSGGLQEEAPALGKPVLVLRDNTERPEAVDAGTVELIGSDRDRIINTTARLFDDQAAYDRMHHAVNPYGDGQASNRIVRALHYYFGDTEVRPTDWQ